MAIHSCMHSVYCATIVRTEDLDNIVHTGPGSVRIPLCERTTKGLGNESEILINVLRF